MRKRALNQAVLAQLRKDVVDGGIAMPTNRSGLAPLMGRPHAMAGDYYVGVWSGARRTTQRPHDGLDEYYSFIITVTLRINGKIPVDRLGTQKIDCVDGADDFADEIRMCIDKNRFTIMADALTIIQTGYASLKPLGLTEPARFAGDGGWRLAGPEWSWAVPDSDPANMVMDLRFDGARMVQSYGDTLTDT